jgi:hypothetical protein
MADTANLARQRRLKDLVQLVPGQLESFFGKNWVEAFCRREQAPTRFPHHHSVRFWRRKWGFHFELPVARQHQPTLEQRPRLAGRTLLREPLRGSRLK